MKVLELTKSPYYTAFSALIKEVNFAHAEATDNVRFLKPLTLYFEQLHNLDNFKARPPSVEAAEAAVAARIPRASSGSVCRFPSAGAA